MPIIRVELLAGRTREQKRELAQVLTRETARIAQCPPDAVIVVFDDVERDNWANGGRLVSEPKPG
jgi:4-oxalocrotonate tautomerase